MIAGRGVDARITQGDMAKPFGLSQSATSLAFTELQRTGYLVEAGTIVTGRPGRPCQQYVLAGAARLAFGGLEA
jgi:predicted ArsR family transcriptional regulator